MRNTTLIYLSFLIIIVLFGASIYIFFSLGLNEWDKVQESRTELAEREMVLDHLNELITKFREQLSYSNDINQQISLIDATLPSSMKMSEIVAIVEALAQESNVEIIQMSFTTLSQNQTPETSQPESFMASNNLPQIITIELNIKATYSDFKNFISNVEQEQRLTDLQSISMNPITQEEFRESSQGFQDFNINLSLNTYYINKPQFTLP